MTGKRKTSRPKVQARISVEELRNQFKRQVSLSQTTDTVVDPLSKAQDSSSRIRGKTAVIYDESMSLHECPWDPNYPECPERFTETLKRCIVKGLIDRCIRLRQRAATKEEILTLHTAKHYEKLQKTKDEQDIELLEKISGEYIAIYIHPKTFEIALQSTGCAIELVEAIVQEKVQNGMAIIRPPGHHAMNEEYCGYSFFNNAAIAARHAVDKLSVKRVLIVDWDVHHGQATQQMFYNDTKVLYFSMHRYEHGSSWPWLRESEYDYVGEKAGKGYNFNIPLNTTGLKNEDYLAVFHQILLPVAYEFGPSLVIVSAGYDSAVGDEKGLMELTPAFYAHLLSSLMNISGGKVAVMLEGGYYIDSLAEGAALTLRCLLGDPCPRLIDPLEKPNPILQETILNVIYAQRQYWKCLQYQGTFSINQPASDTPRHIPSIKYLGPTQQEKEHCRDTRDCYTILSPEELTVVQNKLHRLKSRTCLTVAPHQLCLAYDSEMEKHHPEIEQNEPERPARTRTVMKKLEEFGLLDRMHKLKSRCAKRSELELVHSPPLIDKMEQVEHMTVHERQKLADEYTSTYYNLNTNKAAQLASGCLLEVVDSVCEGQSQRGVAVVRPPGHHAEIDEPHGFCFYNNVAVAAMYAIKKHRLKKILIFDWDIHHGNGIQHIFESDPRVLYVSIHLYKQANFFPYSKDGDHDKLGFGEGEGYNVNIPWNKNKVGDAEYMSAMTQVVLPIAYQFDPDLVFISAGFDAAVNDPLGGCLVTPECFGHMAWMMSALAGGNIIMTLEGGYNLDSTSYSMTMCVKALLGDPLPPLKRNLIPSSHAVDAITKVIDTQSKYWSALSFKVDLPLEDVLNQGLGGGKVDLEDHNTSAESNNDNDSQEEFVTPPETPARKPNYLAQEAKAKKEEEEIGAIGGSDNDNAFLLELINAQEFHAVVPLPWCKHLEEVKPLPDAGFDVAAPCCVCLDKSENWICLTCYQVMCGRYVKKHMVQHGIEKEHNIVLSFSDLSVWCYSCESYIDHNMLFPAKDLAHTQKFGITIECP